MRDRTYGDVIQERIDYKNREIDRLETEVRLLHELREDMDGISVREKQRVIDDRALTEIPDAYNKEIAKNIREGEPFTGRNVITLSELKRINEEEEDLNEK